MKLRPGLLALPLIMVALFGLASSRSGALAQAPDTRTVVEAYKQAFGAGDLDRTFGYFADNAVASDPTGTFVTKADFRRATEGFLAQNPGLTVTFGESVYVLDTALHRVAVSSDPIRAAGVSRIWLIETIVVFNGKIVSYTGVLDLSDAETLRFAQAAGG